MVPLLPELAIVRPRVCGTGSDSPRLLEEIVEEFAADSPAGFLWLVGQEGAGKTTALAHLSAVFRGDDRFAFIDDADQLPSTTLGDNYRSLGYTVLIIAARRNLISSGDQLLQLAAWGVDELVEYLLATHRAQCGEVLQRLGNVERQSWKPGIARIVLEQLVGNQELRDASSALLDYLHHELTDATQFAAACQLCLAREKGGSGEALLSLPPAIGLIPRHVKKLLSSHLVQVPLAAEQVSSALSSGISPRVLEGQLSLALVEVVGKTCRSCLQIHQRLENLLMSGKDSKCHAMAASILHAADSNWRPATKVDNCDYSGAYFSRVNWPGISFACAHLEAAEFFAANLTKACFDEAILVKTDFCQANLHSASLKKSLAVRADFDRANLRGADLSLIQLEQASLVGADLREANLSRANLRQADLTGACFRGANLTEANLVNATLAAVDLTESDLRRADAQNVDLRTAQLDGAILDQICLNGANLEDIDWSGASLWKANLRRAHFTGSMLESANLREADLREAGLGEVEWENADLRGANLSGATFHMGSSRSGLVDSPIACEGSRTGFYTDELEELYFKSPEQVRKANLRGVDLRGADITNVDFYLVDLREAKLDLNQRRQAQRSGAILTDHDL